MLCGAGQHLTHANSIKSHRQAKAQLLPSTASANLRHGYCCMPAAPARLHLRDPRAKAGAAAPQSPVMEMLFGLQHQGQHSPIYKVMLYNDTIHYSQQVVKVLLKVVDGITAEKAQQVMQEAQQLGASMVIACAQEDAEHYCERLRLNGLVSTIEAQ